MTRLAAGLAYIGTKRGDRVALLSENSARFIEAYFAVPWGGGVIAPINHRLSPLEIADILADCGAEILSSIAPMRMSSTASPGVSRSGMPLLRPMPGASGLEKL